MATDLADGVGTLPAKPAAQASERLIAGLIDLVIVAAIVLPLHAIVLGHLRGTPAQDVLFASPAYLYYLLLPMRRGHRRGQTIGKQVINVRVVSASGRSVAVRQIIVREMLRNATGAAILLPAGVGVIGILDPLWILIDRRNRAIHDLVASTQVLDEAPETRSRRNDEDHAYVDQVLQESGRRRRRR